MPARAATRWVIDPIDGTRAFITGSPALGHADRAHGRREPILGLMNQPFTGERFWSDGRQARWRGADGKARRIRTRACARLADAILTTTHPDMFASRATTARASSACDRACA